MAYCSPYRSAVRLQEKLARAKRAGAVTVNCDRVFKGGAPLSFERVLGLGLEQRLLSLFAFGTANPGCECVVFDQVALDNQTIVDHIAVCVNKAHQMFLKGLAEQVLNFFERIGFAPHGVDVPYSVYADGPPSTAVVGKSHDVPGVFRGEMPTAGLATFELLVTQGGSSGNAVDQKAKKTLANYAAAGPAFKQQFLGIAHVKIHENGVELLFWRWLVLNGESWAPAFEGMNVETGRLSEQISGTARVFRRALTDTASFPAQKKRPPAYVLHDFAANVVGKKRGTIKSHKLVKKLRAAGVLGLRLRVSGAGSGGSQVSKGRKQGVWVASETTLWQALPFILDA